ncbi:hypothetical protein HN992_02850 [Candidatus Woesearchaeota archaeon]|jgi:hypothetical protein|nr:hypothetical protein [Candidatus Woesearchaeota archaeon]MBT3438492.1 hypothetical protein [Candidatus Woesearchaeota archaeon]MBT4058423.1 hypothetical protein [Candidatus Woesearchaeota archaeon]MBT4209080.1 hypothetical protein [Candidatus Woesearchaeota archaeon]MBT4733273.1 hypothetical protein [Candidatus Woesearchaeota archaeon]
MHKFPLSKSLEFNLQRIVNYVDGHIKRVKWSDKEINDFFANRTVSEMFENGTTCYMNNCFDFSLTSLEMLKSCGYDTNLIIERVKQKYKNHEEMHFGLEAFDGDYLHFLDYSLMNNVYTGFGKHMNPRSDLVSLERYSIEGDKFDKDSNFFEIIENENNSDLDKFVENYNINIHKQRLIDSNTDKNYEKYLSRLGNHSELVLKYV